MLNANGVNDKGISGEALVDDTAFMERTIEGIAKPLKEHINFFTDISPQIMDRILQVRMDNLQSHSEKEYKNAQNRDREKAAQFFIEHEYMKVITLLKPYSDTLGKADMKKWELAEKYVRKEK